ncbi:MAG: hypothetical protein EZS28_012473 [Streblomastix strix]|uniref:Uncharacterized protein n=1 Tax=Streblomastix strix TaxID=222440 RepID=A0A5J4WAL4_9EUKA|nr:MAG: hypothetical protein EZS28_012473 [Streblomastix strix]
MDNQQINDESVIGQISYCAKSVFVEQLHTYSDMLYQQNQQDQDRKQPNQTFSRCNFFQGLQVTTIHVLLMLGLMIPGLSLWEVTAKATLIKLPHNKEEEQLNEVIQVHCQGVTINTPVIVRFHIAQLFNFFLYRCMRPYPLEEELSQPTTQEHEAIRNTLFNMRIKIRLDSRIIVEVARITDWNNEEVLLQINKSTDKKSNSNYQQHWNFNVCRIS